MSNDVLSIKQATDISQKDQVKDWVGRLMATAMPARTVDLFRTPKANADGFAEKAIMFHLRRRALAENRVGFLERLHRTFWSGELGAQFSQNCDHRFNDLFLVRQQEDYVALKQAWGNAEFNQVVEIGANSGLLLNYLTKNLNGVQKSTGIDINQKQIDLNQASSLFDPRIDFLCTDGPDWILENGKQNTLFATNGGVLEYFPRARLDDMLSHISTNCHPAIFYASEPVAEDHDWETQLESVPFGEEYSFSHNYRDLFESNGFKILHQRPVTYESWRMVATVAVTL